MIEKEISAQLQLVDESICSLFTAISTNLMSNHTGTELGVQHVLRPSLTEICD